MCDKPMTEYLNYKYPTDEAVHQTTASLVPCMHTTNRISKSFLRASTRGHCTGTAVAEALSAKYIYEQL